MLLPVDESFAKSCGQLNPISLKVTSTKGEKTTKIVINKPFAFIGSNLHCDVCLPMPSVSKRHVYVQLIGGRLYCIDQASREGMFWGERQRLFGWLDEGQALRIGPYHVTLLERVGAVDSPSQQATHQGPIQVEEENPNLPQASLQIKEALTLPLHRQLTIVGRSKYCHLELDHEDVSRVHASILRTHDGRYWIVDLMSRTGVKVNGIRCLVSHIADGDVVKIGNYSTTFKIKPAGAPTAASVPTLVVTPESTVVTISSQPSPLSIAAILGDNVPSNPPEPPQDSTPIIEMPVLNSDSPPTNEPAPSATIDQPPLPLSPSPLVPLSISQAKGPSEPAPEQYPPIPLQEGNLVQTPSGNLVRANEGKLQRRRKRRAVKAELAHPAMDMQLVTTILQQMQQMQQEMFSQVRISMEMVAEYVEKMQQNQRESVRHELTELRQLTQELLTLKEQLAKPLLNVRSMVTRQSPALPSNRSERFVAVRVAPVRQQLPSEKSGRKPLPDKAEQERGEALAAEALGLEPSEAPTKEIPPLPAIESTAADSHAWISQRVASLEKERQSRWQRVMAKIMGR